MLSNFITLSEAVDICGQIKFFKMVGILANRAQFGLILPSTNTSVEAEFNRMLVPGK